MFAGFTLSRAGMVRHWYSERGLGYRRKALLDRTGAVPTFAATVTERVSRFLTVTSR